MNRSKDAGSPKDRTDPLVSIVLSFRNEEETIPELLRRLRKVLRDECTCRYELIFVNDDSSDRSRELLMEAAEGYNDIKIINMSTVFGVSPCVLAGMEYSSGDVVIYMDSDLQDPPEVIPELLNAWKNGSDVVHTVRLSREGESRIKLWISKLGYIILKYGSSIDLIINAGDFKLLSRRVVDEVVKLKEKRPFMRGLVHWVGFDQAQVSYHRESRKGGKTKFPVFSRRVINNFLDSALISFSDVPLKVFIVLGLLISFVSFLYLPYLGIKRLLGYGIPEGFLFVAAFFLLGGMILLGIGILGLYISSIFLETKARPNYIVKSTFGFEEDSNQGGKK